MADPLGLIGGVGGTSPIHGGQGPAGPNKTDPNAPDFKKLLMDELKEVNDLQQDATKAIEDLSAGRRDDLEGVLLATQQADTAFRMLLQVRNKMMEAYEEIKQIRV